MRIGDLFTEERVARVAKFAALGFAVAFFALLTQARDLVFPTGRGVGADFVLFWAASDLALGGEPGQAYEPEKIIAAERKAVPQSKDAYLWLYPPPFQLVVLPLALLPYLWAYGLWLALSLALYAVTFRAAFREAAPFWLAAGASAVFVNAMHGQNGLLSATLATGGLMLLQRRPLLAGALLGLLCYKPHFGIPLGLMLLAGRHWQAATAAVISAIVFCLLSTAVLGIDVWRTFIEHAATASTVLETGATPWFKMASVFAAARLAGGGVQLAYALHAIIAAAVLLATLEAWYRGGPLDLRVALAAIAAPLISPYVYDYDLALTVLTLALLLRDGFRNGWSPGMRLAIAVLWLAPAILPSIAEATHIQLQPLALFAVWGLAWRRLRLA